MPCLEEADLSKIAELHIQAQRSVIANLKNRVSELDQERSQLLKQGATPETSERLKTVEKAIKHLRLELYGEVETQPGSMKFQRDPNKKPAEERFAVMERLYRDRKHYTFYDTTRDLADPRKASVFGLPTIQEMLDRGHADIAEEMMVRAVSLLEAKDDTRNPIDFLDTRGLETKLALSNAIEHHHIFNNTYVNEQGRVQFKSFRISADKNGELTMSVIPSYWNAKEHGRNTQFVALMDAMHSGDDPVTHMHYYRFTDEEAAPIKDKIRADVGKKVEEAKTTATRLQEKLDDLEARRSDPRAYERGLEKQFANAQAELGRIETENQPFKGKRNLTDEQRIRKEELAAEKKVWDSEAKRIQRKLDEHRTIQSLRNDIQDTENAISDLQAQIKGINLNKVPKGEERERKKAERDQLTKQVTDLKYQLKDQKKLLEAKGDIDEQIAKTQRSLQEAQLIAGLTEEKAIALFESQNGFFSFDKGTEEKNDHSTYRSIMNEEITRFYVREAIAYLQSQHGDRWQDELNQMIERRYRSNLVERLGALTDKLDPSSRSKRTFFEGEWGGEEN